MKSIVVLGFDKEFCIKLAKQLAKLLSFKFVNAETKFENLLLKTSNISLLMIDEMLKEKETEFLIEASLLENAVIYMDNDTFLTNEHYKLFKNLNTILIEQESKKKIFNNIQELMKKHCKFSFKQKELDISNVISVLKG